MLFIVSSVTRFSPHCRGDCADYSTRGVSRANVIGLGQFIALVRVRIWRETSCLKKESLDGDGELLGNRWSY